MSNNTSGFTLVELIIVSATISVISVGLVSTINPSNLIKRANDTKLANELHKAKISQEEYFNNKDCYPTTKILDDVPSDSYLYVTDGSNCPHWYTFFGYKKTYSLETNACHLPTNCLPVNYQKKWDCLVPEGNYDCAIIAGKRLPNEPMPSSLPTTIPTVVPTVGMTLSPTIPIVSKVPSVGITLPPNTSDSSFWQAVDGTWCYDSDGGRRSTSFGYFDHEYNTPGFCIDNTGTRQDYCQNVGLIQSSVRTGCQRNSNGATLLSVKCYSGRYDCPNLRSGNVCQYGACTDAGAPAPISSMTIPTTKTLSGTDGTWCYDSDGNNNIDVKGTCQDNSGIYTDYCVANSTGTVDYKCSGMWNGSGYSGIKCTAGVGLTPGCIDGVINRKVGNTGIGPT